MGANAIFPKDFRCVFVLRDAKFEYSVYQVLKQTSHLYARFPEGNKTSMACINKEYYKKKSDHGFKLVIK